jgi:O-antigen/teichoic acid export membrane protein
VIRALWRDGAIYALGTIVSRGLGLLLLPLYTYALPPDSFGLLDLIVTAGILVNLVVPLETPQSLARLWNERGEGMQRRVLAGTCFTFAAIGYTIFVVAIWHFAAPIASVLSGESADAGAVQAGAAFIAASGLMLVLQAQFRSALRPRAYAMSGVAYSVLVLAGLSAMVAAGATSVSSVLWVQGGSAGVVSIACAWILRGDIAWGVDRHELGKMLLFSLPLVPAGIAMFVTMSLHRFVLNSLGTLDEVGLFGLASRLASVGTLVLIGVQSALTPLIYSHHHEAETPARLGRLLEGFWALSLLACLALAAFGPEVLSLLAAPAYGDASRLVVWLAPAALLSQMYILAPGIPLAKKTGWQLALTVLSGTTGLCLSVVLVPRWQALGAAVSACIASALFFGAWLILGQRLYPLPIRWGSLAVATIVYVGLSVVATQIMTWPPGVSTWLAKSALLMILVLALGYMGLLRLKLMAWRRVQVREEI